MCARMSLLRPERILDRFPGYTLPGGLTAREVVAPTDPVLVATAADGALRPMRWGLVPRWAPDATFGRRAFNARVETLADKPAFRDALRARRGLIFADAFTEWTGPVRAREPVRFTVDGGATFAFAALWESWGAGADGFESATVVTCAPNALLAAIHDRMPAILDGPAIDAWLRGTVTDALAAVAPFDAARMTRSEAAPTLFG